MSQTFSALQSGVTTFNQLYGILNNNIDAIRSQWSGTSAPGSPVVGQPFYNTTTGKITIWNGTSWVDPATTSTTVLAYAAEILEARGSAASLDARLSVSINDDGTLKSDAPVGDWWMNEADAVAFVDASTFTVAGDKTAIYITDRAVYFTQTSNDYGYVVSSSYNSGTDLTTVIVTEAVVDSGLSAVEYGQPVNNAPYTSDFLKTTDIGITVEAADGTILKDADIGVTVQPYDAWTVVAPDGVLPALDGSNLTGIPQPDIGQLLGFENQQQDFFSTGTITFAETTLCEVIGCGGGGATASYGSDSFLQDAGGSSSVFGLVFSGGSARHTNDGVPPYNFVTNDAAHFDGVFEYAFAASATYKIVYPPYTPPTSWPTGTSTPGRAHAYSLISKYAYASTGAMYKTLVVVEPGTYTVQIGAGGSVTNATGNNGAITIRW